MKINPIIYGALVVTVFFGVILGFQTAGIWSTSGKVDSDGKQIQPSQLDVETIKGWMTLEQIVTTYRIPLADILAEFSLPTDTPITTAIKDLESDTFDTDGLRIFLQKKIDGSVPPSEESAPIPAATKIPPAASESAPLAEPTEHATAAGTVTGSTTFQNLYDWGVGPDAILAMFGENPPPEEKVKDYVVGKGLPFSDFKTRIQGEVDKAK